MPAKKWDWDEARRLGKIYGREPSTIVSCWRDGRPVGEKTFATNAKTKEMDLALVIMARNCQEPMTRNAIAEVCGCTREAIRVIELKALRKLRALSEPIIKETHATFI